MTNKLILVRHSWSLIQEKATSLLILIQLVKYSQLEFHRSTPPILQSWHFLTLQILINIIILLKSKSVGWLFITNYEVGKFIVSCCSGRYLFSDHSLIWDYSLPRMMCKLKIQADCLSNPFNNNKLLWSWFTSITVPYNQEALKLSEDFRTVMLFVRHKYQDNIVLRWWFSRKIWALEIYLDSTERIINSLWRNLDGIFFILAKCTRKKSNYMRIIAILCSTCNFFVSANYFSNLLIRSSALRKSV